MKTLLMVAGIANICCVIYGLSKDEPSVIIIGNIIATYMCAKMYMYMDKQ